MPPLPRYTATTPPPRDSGLARANAGAMAGTQGAATAQSLANLGSAIQNVSELGARVVDQKLEADANLQYRKVTQNSKDFIRNQTDELDKTEITDDEQRRKIEQEYAGKFDNFLNEQINSVSPRARKKLELWKTEAMPEYAGHIGRTTNTKWRDYQVGEGKKDAGTAVTNGQPDLAKQIISDLDKLELITHEEAVRLSSVVDTQWTTIQKEQKAARIDELQSVYEQDVTNTAEQLGYDKAQERANSPEYSRLFAEQGLSLTEQEKIRNVVKSRATEKIQQMQSEANKQLTDMMKEKTLSFAEIEKRRNTLTDTDYKQWNDILLKPVDKKGNEIDAVNLENETLNIWRGVTTPDEIANKARASLANPDGINDKQYAGIMAKAGQALKDTQASAMSKAVGDAKEILVTSVMGDDETALETIMRMRQQGDNAQAEKFSQDRQAAYDNLHLVEQQLREYITKNPDASMTDIYIESKRAIAVARKRTVKAVRTITEQQEDTDFQTWWEKLPSGTEFQAPNGRTWKKK